MKVSYKWLKDYINLDVSADELAEKKLNVLQWRLIQLLNLVLVLKR